MRYGKDGPSMVAKLTSRSWGFERAASLGAALNDNFKPPELNDAEIRKAPAISAASRILRFDSAFRSKAAAAAACR
jgi:hypothetical protein